MSLCEHDYSRTNEDIDTELGITPQRAFKTVSGNFQRDTSPSAISSDSEFSDDGVSPKKMQYPSKAKRLSAMNNLDVIKSPMDVSFCNVKKRKLETVQNRISAVPSSQGCSKRISTLQQLTKEEKDLKIAIAYEKLRKEQPVILDPDILHEKIAECQQVLQDARNKCEMKNVMCQSLQKAFALERIVRKSKEKGTLQGFSKYIEDLLKKKKELNRSETLKRKEIAQLDEEILKLEKDFSPTKETRSRRAKMDNLELERLEENSVKVAKRIHFLSNVIQSLIPQSGRQEDPDLVDLMEKCETVSSCTLDNLDEIKALLECVASVEL